MAQTTCPICRGFGKVHPRVGGKADYSSLIFCTCRGDKAGQAAHPPVFHPDIDSDIKCERFYDEFDADRQARYRKSPEFKREIKEMFEDQSYQLSAVSSQQEQGTESRPTPRMLRAAALQHDNEEIPRKDGWRELIALKAEFNTLKNKMNELQNGRRLIREDRL